MHDANPLWEHQKEAIERASKLDYFGLFFEQGTGKTRTTIEILQNLYMRQGKMLPTLIICLPIVLENWRRELEKYSSIEKSKIHIVYGNAWQRLLALDHIWPGIYI